MPGRCLLLFCLAIAAAWSAPLRVGVAPDLSARSLLAYYAPLREYLEQELGQPVALATAKDESAYARRIARQEFELIIAAPPLARAAQQYFGYSPLQAMQADFYTLLLVPQTSSLNQLADLRGQRINIPSASSFVTVQGQAFLQRFGLQAQRDYQLESFSSENNAVLALMRGRGDAALVSRPVYERLPKSSTSWVNVRVLASTGRSISHIVLLRAVDSDLRQQLGAALSRFAYTPAGIAFARGSGLEFVPVRERMLSVYEDDARRWHEQVGRSPASCRRGTCASMHGGSTR